MNITQSNQNKFIQFHFLTAYPPSLLNRDDVGFAKRIPFGNATRVRISSQCLKRHWRTHEGMHSMKNLPVEASIHSRKIFSELIFEPLYQEFGAQHALEAAKWLQKIVFGESESAKKKEAKGGEKKETVLSYEDAKKATLFSQIVVLGTAEVEYMLQVGREYCQIKDIGSNALKELEKKLKENLKALGKGATGLDAALFGRMTTSDLLARSDAAIHVSHALTVHPERVETDYFTAVDDFEVMGSAHINNTELTSSLFYGYIVVDLPLLVSNLSGCKRQDWHLQDLSLASKTIQTLLYLIATVSPGAKKGSTAPYSYSNFILAEAGHAQPCSLANAFLEAIKTGEDMVKKASSELCSFANKIEKMYGFGNKRGLVSLNGDFESISGASQFEKMEDLAAWLDHQIHGR